MKILYCWRCKMDVPMLDEAEFAVIHKLYRGGFDATKEFREQHNLSLGHLFIDERFRPVREAYAQMAGWNEPNEHAIMHHRLSYYGPPCKQCGKPLRTPVASFCAACGAEVQ
ncbi:MAG: hypothetical protein MUD01_24980 [Chloroflexaceae bacterium]|jgi:hypothetical protein|nr:hypothetical protein [Chloroflexaceae bacterium]